MLRSPVTKLASNSNRVPAGRVSADSAASDAYSAITPSHSAAYAAHSARLQLTSSQSSGRVTAVNASDAAVIDAVGAAFQLTCLQIPGCWRACQYSVTCIESITLPQKHQGVGGALARRDQKKAEGLEGKTLGIAGHSSGGRPKNLFTAPAVHCLTGCYQCC